MQHSFICESSRIITLDKKETNLQYYIKLQQIKNKPIIILEFEAKQMCFCTKQQQ